MAIRLPTRPLRLLVLLAFALAPATATAQSHDDPHGPELNFFKREHGDTVSLLTGAGDTALVSEIVIRPARDTLAVSTADGVGTVAQDPVRSSGGPFVGPHFHSRSRPHTHRRAPGRERGGRYR